MPDYEQTIFAKVAPADLKYSYIYTYIYADYEELYRQHISVAWCSNCHNDNSKQPSSLLCVDKFEAFSTYRIAFLASNT